MLRKSGDISGDRLEGWPITAIHCTYFMDVLIMFTFIDGPYIFLAQIVLGLELKSCFKTQAFKKEYT